MREASDLTVIRAANRVAANLERRIELLETALKRIERKRGALVMSAQEKLELCQDCRWVILGGESLLPICANRKSEFGRGQVHPHGWCPEWSDQAAEVVTFPCRK